MTNNNGSEFIKVQYKKSKKHNDQEIRNLQRQIYSPKVDLVERNDTFMIRIEIPGIDKNSIKINIKDNQFVLISGSKEFDQILDTDKIIYRESKFNDFTRRVKLPGTVLSDYSSTFSNGVLYIHFTKENTLIFEEMIRLNENTTIENWADI